MNGGFSVVENRAQSNSSDAISSSLSGALNELLINNTTGRFEHSSSDTIAACSSQQCFNAFSTASDTLLR